MPIILPETYQPDDRALAILTAATMIDDAMTSDEPTDLCDLATRIVDEIEEIRLSGEMEAEWLASRPDEPEVERLSEIDSARLSAARRDYLARRKARLSRPPKPRISIWAATQHSA